MNTTVSSTIAEFFSHYPVRSYQKGQVLVQAGEDPPGIMYLTSGSVKQYDIAKSGEQIVVNVFKQPAFFPMSWAINKTSNQYFFETATDVEMRIAPAAAVVQFLRDNPDVTFDLLGRVYLGTDGLLRRTAHLMGGSAHSRLLFELIVEAKRFGTKNSKGHYLVTISEGELAKRAGLSRETVSRELRSYKTTVEVSRRGILVRDLSAIEQELGDVI